ncbi:hypothetical protein Hesp01_05660 [Herbidospora sp. NBRC 101105]|nr:hypothetical protein Hesp01_05660 [Herbidospora sp. NBRC 101105]
MSDFVVFRDREEYGRPDRPAYSLLVAVIGVNGESAGFRAPIRSAVRVQGDAAAWAGCLAIAEVLPLTWVVLGFEVGDLGLDGGSRRWS